MASRILIVDDDAVMSNMLERLLRQEGWNVQSTLQAAHADRLLALHRPDVVLLDVMLADGNGLEICRRWRAQHPAIGILMLSARGDPMDKVLGLELGADDYLSKPFERRELVARVRSLMRRHQPLRAAADGPATRLEFGALVIDLAHREALVHGQAVALTNVEFKLLLALARLPGQPQSRLALSETAQPGNYRPLDRTVDVQVGRLRRKLQDLCPDCDWIATVRGEGYAFAPQALAGTAAASHDRPPI